MISSKGYLQIFSKPILFVGILLLVAGAFSFTRMQTNLFPEVLFPRITIIADAGQLPIDRMMITVTKPLESAVKRVQGVTIVKSSTSRGVCTIDIFFDWGNDTYAKKLQIESRINEIKNFLPLVQDGDACAELLDLVEQVRGEQDGEAQLLLQALDGEAHLVDALRGRDRR